MIRNVQIVTVYVSNQDKALDFYVNKLGFEKRSDNPFGEGLRWLEVAPPGAQTTIVLAKDYGDWRKSRVGTFTGIVFDTADCRQTHLELSERGVRFTEEPTQQPWGMTQAQFVDEDGNGYVLVGP